MVMVIEYKGEEMAYVNTDGRLIFIKGPDLNEIIDKNIGAVQETEDEYGNVLLEEAPAPLDVALTYLRGLGFKITEKRLPVLDVSKASKKSVLDKMFEEAKVALKLADKKTLDTTDLEKIKDFLIQELNVKANDALDAFIMEKYSDELDALEKQMKVNAIDSREGYQTLLNSDEKRDAFEKLKAEQFLKFNDIVAASQVDGVFQAEVFRENLEQLADFTESRLDLITRTTANKISNTARLNIYKEFDTEETRYKLINPQDRRTDKACSEVITGQGAGLPLHELLALMAEKSRKYFPDFNFDPRAPVMHYNSRSVVVRIHEGG